MQPFTVLENYSRNVSRKVKGKRIVYQKKGGYFVTVAFTAATGGLRSVAGVL